jgi:hypothetical protein
MAQYDSTIRLTTAQRKLLEDEELRKCRYREDQAKGCVVIEYDGFPLIEIPMSWFKEARDFRDIPVIAEKILHEFNLQVKLKPRKETGQVDEDKNK